MRIVLSLVLNVCHLGHLAETKVLKERHGIVHVSRSKLGKSIESAPLSQSLLTCITCRSASLCKYLLLSLSRSPVGGKKPASVQWRFSGHVKLVGPLGIGADDETLLRYP